MFPPNKHIYRKKIRDIFRKIRTHKWHNQIMAIPFVIRVIFASVLFLLGIVALVTPIPAGWAMLLISGVLVFGIGTIHRHSVRIFFRLRLHRVIRQIQHIWKR